MYVGMYIYVWLYLFVYIDIHVYVSRYICICVCVCVDVEMAKTDPIPKFDPLGSSETRKLSPYLVEPVYTGPVFNSLG